jgi:hypothetical protein
MAQSGYAVNAYWLRSEMTEVDNPNRISAVFTIFADGLSESVVDGSITYEDEWLEAMTISSTRGPIVLSPSLGFQTTVAEGQPVTVVVTFRVKKFPPKGQFHLTTATARVDGVHGTRSGTTGNLKLYISGRSVVYLPVLAR